MILPLCSSASFTIKLDYLKLNQAYTDRLESLKKYNNNHISQDEIIRIYYSTNMCF